MRSRFAQFSIDTLTVVLWIGLAIKLILVSNVLACCGAFPAHRAVMTTAVACVLWILIPTLWFRPTARFIAAAGANVLGSLVALSDLLHARFFGDPVSVSEFVHAWQLSLVMDSVRASLRPSHLWLFADVVILTIIGVAVHWSASANRAPTPRWLRLAAVAAAIALTIPGMRLAAVDPEGVIRDAIGRRQVVAAIGLPGYHVYDIARHARYQVFNRWTVGDDEIEWAVDILRQRAARADGHVSSPAWGAARGANVIAIQAESLQAFPIDLEIDGHPVMPHLRALMRESLVAERFLDQAAGGATSDAAFGALQSLHPASVGSVVTRYPTNRYHGLPAILRDQGYDTFAVMGASGEWWRFRQLFEAMGIVKACLECSALDGRRFGQGLADGDVFRDAIPLLEALREPFFSFLVTVSNHHPYEIPQDLSHLPVGPLANTLTGRYLESVHYFDESLGEFLAALKEAGLLDRSILVIYGDHQGYLDSPPELRQLLPLLADRPITLWEETRRLPLVIRLPRGERAGVIEEPAGHLDIAPTILTLLGVGRDSNVMLGGSLFEDRTASPVVFRDGSFAVGNDYLLTQDSSGARAGCYESLSGHSIDCAQIDALRQTALDELRLSDLIVRGDLIPVLRDRLAMQPPETR